MGKWFAQLYDMFMMPIEKRGFHSIRKELLENATGAVLEIGAGTGLNFPYYQHVDKVVAIEPNQTMRERAQQRLAFSNFPIELLEGDAQQLPYPDNTFDTIVGTLVFCTIPNPDIALREMKRVCKPDGKLLLFEHVRLSHTVFGRIQDYFSECVMDAT
ncbi:class I SAM-dependent methyltransferase [Brevibacillus panacihumi]|uniref:class I SAM-dependent methyltransferase n=1 Tax=Brevibacillus panacihumi TaxID=497735 RepID=UPI003D01E661